MSIKASIHSPYAKVHETHAGVVVLIADKAFKLKKPVKFEFLDFETPEKRQRALQRELELNRRLAPDIYIGIYALCDEQGQSIEPVLVMKRMPEGRSLEELARSGKNIDRCIGQIARKIAQFHHDTADSTTSDAIAAQGKVAVLKGRWSQNFSDLRLFVPDLFSKDELDALESSALEYLEGRQALFERRIAEGQIKDGHGDLLSADIFCLDSGPAILDCIEFDETLRYCDVASEIAFLAMDLLRLGKTRQARLFLEKYVQVYGIPIPYTLLEHYISYRACVRSKVAALSYEQGRGEMAQQARLLLEIAKDHARRAVPLLVLVGGPPGTGKTSLAKAIRGADPFAEAISNEPRFELIRSDVVRKELAGMEELSRSGAQLDGGIYSADFTTRTYQEMAARAQQHLEMGRSVILDATFADEDLRKIQRAVAKKARASVVELCLHAPMEVCEERIVERAARGMDPSEADPEIARAIRARFDEWPTAASVDTSENLKDSLSCAVAEIERQLKTTIAWA